MGEERKRLSEKAFGTEHLSCLKGWDKRQHGESRLVLSPVRKTSQEAANVILKKDDELEHCHFLQFQTWPVIPRKCTETKNCLKSVS